MKTSESLGVMRRPNLNLWKKNDSFQHYVIICQWAHLVVKRRFNSWTYTPKSNAKSKDMLVKKNKKQGTEKPCENIWLVTPESAGLSIREWPFPMLNTSHCVMYCSRGTAPGQRSDLEMCHLSQRRSRCGVIAQRWRTSDRTVSGQVEIRVHTGTWIWQRGKIQYLWFCWIHFYAFLFLFFCLSSPLWVWQCHRNAMLQQCSILCSVWMFIGAASRF